MTVVLLMSGEGAAEEQMRLPPVKASFHVAPDGKDNNPGTAAAPFATLGKARDGKGLMRLSYFQQALLRRCGNQLPNHDPCFSQSSLSRQGDMETATLRLLSAGRLHFQQAEPIAGKGRRDLHHAGTGGCPDERHDAEIIHLRVVRGRSVLY